jgi:transcriptional regulator with XRE-family HTH domain
VKPSTRKPRRKPEPIHGRIRDLRKRLDMTQTALADALGVHVTAVNHWEKGSARPAGTRLASVAKALGVTVDALIAGERVK